MHAADFELEQENNVEDNESDFFLGMYVHRPRFESGSNVVHKKIWTRSNIFQEDKSSKRGPSTEIIIYDEEYLWSWFDGIWRSFEGWRDVWTGDDVRGGWCYSRRDCLGRESLRRYMLQMPPIRTDVSNRIPRTWVTMTSVTARVIKRLTVSWRIHARRTRNAPLVARSNTDEETLVRRTSIVTGRTSTRRTCLMISLFSGIVSCQWKCLLHKLKMRASSLQNGDEFWQMGISCGAEEIW